MNDSQPSTLFLSVPRAAREMGIGIERLKRAIRDGQVQAVEMVPAVEIGHRKLVPRRAIERLARLEA
jgi:hypothetical protein